MNRRELFKGIASVAVTALPVVCLPSIFKLFAVKPNESYEVMVRPGTVLPDDFLCIGGQSEFAMYSSSGGLMLSTVRYRKYGQYFIEEQKQYNSSDWKRTRVCHERGGEMVDIGA